MPYRLALTAGLRGGLLDALKYPDLNLGHFL
jgi:hypothetical protein